MDFQRFIKNLTSDNEIIVKGSHRNLLARSKHGTKRFVKIPLKNSPELCFLVGCIISDGHLRKTKFAVTIEITDKKILSLIKKKFEKSFMLKLKTHKVRDKRLNRKMRWALKFESKAIWLLFTRVFEIPPGKKNDCVSVPQIILKTKNLECKKQFISGLFLGDGGTSGKRISFTFSNKMLCSGVKRILNQFGISSWTSEWIHKVSKKTIFNIFISSKIDINKFIINFPLTKLKLQGYLSGLKGMKKSVISC